MPPDDEDDLLLKKIQDDLAAERARRPNGYATRCEYCQFWQMSRHQDRFADEDREGECHRYAPHAPHQHTAAALGMIAHAVEELAKIEHDASFDYLFESADSPYPNFPLTTAKEWCGEFVRRP